jgi:FkbM family methyltransferase
MAWKAPARKSDFVFDLGANVGLVTKKLLQAECFVYAFEPDPEAFKELEKINSPRLSARNVAVWTKKGKPSFIVIETGNFQNHTHPHL